MAETVRSVDEYLAALSDEQLAAMRALRDSINSRIPPGFSEAFAYGMITWVVPKESYPAGYHCDPTKPLMLMGLSAGKSAVTLHHMGLYSGVLVEWLKQEWEKNASGKLDMGKGCIRFKKLENIPTQLIGDLATKLTPEQWVEQYEAARSSSSRKP